MSENDEDEVWSDEEGEEEKRQEVAVDKKYMPVCQLTPEIISRGLSLLCQTGNGLGHAFIRLDVREKRLNDIAAISTYIHLRFLDISHNQITDLSPLAPLTHLLWLKVDNNALTTLKEQQPFAQLTHLQWLNMAVNTLTDVEGLVGPALETLNLIGNKIQKVDGLQGSCFDNLVTLELRGNCLDTAVGINLPRLQKLYLAKNVIKHLEGLYTLECLTTLHLRDNQLDTLDGLSPNMKCLKYLNVRGNNIKDENSLQSLRHVSKTLQTLVICENPLMESTEYRLNILILLPQLERLDKDPISTEERAEAMERIKELEEEESSDQ